MNSADRAKTATGSSTPSRRGESVLICNILGVFGSQYREAMPVREIARLLGTNPGSVHRVLVTMEDHRLLVKSPDGSYRLGPVVESLALVLAAQDKNVSIERHLKQLQLATGETASLTEVRDGVKVITHQAECNAELRMTLPVGKPLPVIGTVSDMLFHAFRPGALSADPLPSRLAGLSSRELARLREDGYAISEGTIAPGTLTLGAAVYDGDEVKVLTVVGPEARMRERGNEFYLDHLLAIARDLQTSLNYSDAAAAVEEHRRYGAGLGRVVQPSGVGPAHLDG